MGYKGEPIAKRPKCGHVAMLEEQKQHFSTPGNALWAVKHSFRGGYNFKQS